MDDRPLVACDDELTTFRPALEAAGYRVTTLHEAPMDRVDAVVVSRLDSNLLGDTTRLTPAVVVNAAGMTPGQLVRYLDERLKDRRR